jgi:hypothetical protein
MRRRIAAPGTGSRNRAGDRLVVTRSVPRRWARRAWPRSTAATIDDPDADGGERRVECRGEFGIPVPDQDLWAVGVAFIRVQLLYGTSGSPRAVS